MSLTSSNHDAAPTLAVQVLRCEAGKAVQSKEDALTVEEPLEIRVRGKSIAVTMRTPGQDHQLAAGFLFTEGIIRQRTDIVEIAHCAQADSSRNVLNVFLAPNVELDLERLTRHVFASSSCGVCGKASIDAVRQNFAPVQTDVVLSSAMLFELPQRMRAAQHTFAQTGGLHAAGLFNAKGMLLSLCEDVGRHNAVDKVVGESFLKNELPLDQHVLLVSGRASFEIMQKALAARIAIVCAVSAPSSLAVEFAKDSGQTLVGFLRDRSLNAYTYPERIERE